MHKPTLLIVEDDPSSRFLLRTYLEDKDYHLLTAENGRDALEKLHHSERCDVVISDIYMPEMDGLRLLRETRKERSDIEFILMTGNASLDTAVKAMEAGAFTYLIKPINLDALHLFIQRALEIQRLRSVELESNRYESLRVLVGGLAHDFNNLLNVILGNAELGQSEADLSQELMETFSNIEQAAGQAAELTNQLLAYSAQGNYLIDELDLTDLVREYIEEKHSELPRNISYRFELIDSLPAFSADREQIHLVLRNLLMNAHEALQSEGGTITIRTGSQELSELQLRSSVAAGKSRPGSFVYLEISDDGPGLEKELVDKVFDPFFSTRFIGKGLGLSAVRGVIYACRGAIQLDTAKGSGFTIRVLFPVESLA